MALVTIRDFKGINKDLSIHEMPLEFVSDASNVRFRDGLAELFYGEQAVYGTPSAVPYSLLPVQVGTTRYWLYAGLKKAYCVTGTTHTDLTRAAGDYTGTATTGWVGCVINGFPILTNNTDAVQMWNPVSATQVLQALTTWPANYKCKSIRAHKGFLIAVNITDNTTPYPHRVLWSTQAEPGTVPVTWDVTDLSEDAGQVDIPGSDHLVDSMTLGQVHLVYGEHSTTMMQAVASNDIFVFQNMYSQSGILAKNCVTSLDGAHVVLTPSDVVLITMGGIQSILDAKTRRWLFQNLDTTNYLLSFVTQNSYFNEVWVCFPSIGATSCDTALVYNTKNGAVTFRDLPSIFTAGSGAVDAATVSAWASDSQAWDDDVSNWNQAELTPDLQRLVLGGSGPGLWLTDSSGKFGSGYIAASMERVGLSLGMPGKRKLLRSLRPRMQAPNGTQVSIQLGAHEDLHGPVTWQAAKTFTVGSGFEVDSFAAGRYLAYRIQTTNAVQWQIDSIDLDVAVLGDY